MFDINSQIIIPNKIDEVLVEYMTCNVEDKSFLDSMFSYKILNKKDRPNVLSLSLFYKDINRIQKNDTLSEKLIKESKHSDNKDKWSEYFQKILDFGPEFVKNNPDKKIRIYLDPECYFLIDRLMEFAEIYLMDNTSISAQPGAMWRMLAFEDNSINKVVCWDADNMHIYRNSYPLFNSSSPFSKLYNSVSTLISPYDKIVYRFLQCGLIGTNIKIPISYYMKAFIYYDMKNKSKKSTNLSYGDFQFFGTNWPFYGFDEWFTHNILFPITQEKGTDVFVPRDTFTKICLNEFMVHEFKNGKNNFILT